MRILFCTEYLPPYVSGISNRCKNLINGYREHGMQVVVYSVQGTDCDFEVNSIPNPFYPAQRTFCLPPLCLLLELLDFSRPVPYDICHLVAPLCFAFLWLIPLLKLRGVRIYVSYHVFLEYYFQAYVSSSFLLLQIVTLPFVLLYYLPLVYLADCVGIPSKTADHYVLKYSRRIHLLKSGLDTRVFNPTPSKHRHSGVKGVIETPVGVSDFCFSNIRDYTGASTVMVYAGRLAPEKNIEFLISALSDERMDKFSLVIVGDGPCRTALEQLAIRVVGKNRVMNERDIRSREGGDFTESAAKSGNASTSLDSQNPTTKRVIFTGMILDEYQVASFYAQSDVFVSASASETFGFTVAEAMACGTPAVVVRSGAFKTVYKMIDDWMFTEDDQQDFIDKLYSATSQKTNRKLARDIAVAGFSVDTAIDDFLATYNQIIDGNFVSQI